MSQDLNKIKEMLRAMLEMDRRGSPKPWVASNGSAEGWPVAFISFGSSMEDGEDWNIGIQGFRASDLYDSGADCDAKTDAQLVALSRNTFKSLILATFRAIHFLENCESSHQAKEAIKDMQELLKGLEDSFNHGGTNES